MLVEERHEFTLRDMLLLNIAIRSKTIKHTLKLKYISL